MRRVLFLVVALLQAHVASAQTPATSFLDLAATLKPHALVTVVVTDDRNCPSAFRGKVIDFMGDALRLEFLGRQRSVDEAHVLRITQSHPARRRALLVGALMWIPAGALLGEAVHHPAARRWAEFLVPFDVISSLYVMDDIERRYGHEEVLFQQGVGVRWGKR